MLEKVEAEYDNREFIELGEILQVIGILLTLSHERLYPKSKEEILEDSKQYIDYLVNNNKIDLKILFDGSRLIQSTFAYKRVTVQGTELKEFKDFTDYFDVKRASAIENHMPRLITYLIDTMVNDFWRFDRMISQNTYKYNYDTKEGEIPEPIYFEKPILSYVDSNHFFDIFLSLDSRHQMYICQSIKNRYASQDNNKNLLQELDWLKSIKNLLQEEADRRKGKLSRYRFNSYIEEYFNPAIETLEQSNSYQSQS